MICDKKLDASFSPFCWRSTGSFFSDPPLHNLGSFRSAYATHHHHDVTLTKKQCVVSSIQHTTQYNYVCRDEFSMRERASMCTMCLTRWSVVYILDVVGRLLVHSFHWSPLRSRENVYRSSGQKHVNSDRLFYSALEQHFRVELISMFVVSEVTLKMRMLSFVRFRCSYS